jgi:hypothetical protein
MCALLLGSPFSPSWRRFSNFTRSLPIPREFAGNGRELRGASQGLPGPQN